MPPNEDTALDPRDYLVVLRRRKWVVIVTALVAVAAALVISLLQTPEYRATAELLIRGDSTPSLDDSGGDAERNIQNERQFLESDAVVSAVRDELGFAPDVSIGASEDADVLVVAATSPRAREAAEVANTYAETYLTERERAAVEAYDRTAQSIEDELAQVRTELTERQAELATAAGAVQAQPGNPQAVQQQQQIQAQIDQLNARVTDLQDSLGQIRLDRGLVGTSGAEISEGADVPTAPSSPRTLRNTVIALFLGLILGVGLAFLVEYLDNSVKTKADLERVTGGLTVLGLIPHVDEWRARDRAELVSLAEPASPAAEAYRSLRVALQFSGLDQSIEVLMVTSAASSEGKSTTAANLAVAAARGGQRVLVVDADQRRPRLHEFFGCQAEPGLTSVLLGDKLRDCIQPVSGIENLGLVAAGPPPPDPAEVLGSAPVGALFAELREIADLVIVDTPPVVPVADALAVSHHADGTLLVASAGRSSKRELARAVELLQQINSPIVGTTLNDVDPAAGYQYGYGFAERGS
jgi:non-specific protein-tyrosine kinase